MCQMLKMSDKHKPKQARKKNNDPQIKKKVRKKYWYSVEK